MQLESIRSEINELKGMANFLYDGEKKYLQQIKESRKFVVEFLITDDV